MKLFTRIGLWLSALTSVWLGIFWASSLRPSGRSVSTTEAVEQAAPTEEGRLSASTLEARQRGLERIGAAAWHQRGFRGKGVKVAILDTGFRGHQSFLGKGLPAKVTARSFRRDGELEARPSQHGVLCAEIIHALAPEAEILLANWEPDHPEAFLEAVAWARRQGARVCSCSVIMPGWSDGQGGGSVHRELAKELGDGRKRSDLLFCACAGNTARRHWTGAARPDADGWHCWRGGERGIGVAPWGAERVAVELYGPHLPPGCLEVVQQGSGRVVGAVELSGEAEANTAAVRFDPAPGVDYVVKLRVSKPERTPFHMVVLGGNLTHAETRDSIAFPGDGANVLTATAVDEEGARKYYSSCGPSGDRTKPDFAAMVPFPSLVREQPFSGTSAAAPQLAGLSALVLSRHSDWSPREVLDYLRRASLDLGSPGLDPETGHGLARLPAP